jgi:sulfite exporter TauE/SafE
VLDLALIGSAALLGMAGTLHCTAMCAAACTAATGGRVGTGARWGASDAAFHVARAAGYAAGGALAAGSVGALAALGQWSPALRPLWTLLHVAALGLGLWLLWQGRQPAWMERIGRVQRPAAALAGGWQPIAGPARAATAGALWVAWPCGLLQSALLVAALANSAWAGAAAMAAFASTSAGGLLLAPWAWRRWQRGGASPAWPTRVAGALLVAASGWALGHGVWQRVIDFCASAVA